MTLCDSTVCVHRNPNMQQDTVLFYAITIPYYVVLETFNNTVFCNTLF